MINHLWNLPYLLAHNGRKSVCKENIIFICRELSVNVGFDI